MLQKIGGTGMKKWWNYKRERKNKILGKNLVLVALYSKHVSH